MLRTMSTTAAPATARRSAASYLRTPLSSRTSSRLVVVRFKDEGRQDETQDRLREGAADIKGKAGRALDSAAQKASDVLDTSSVGDNLKQSTNGLKATLQEAVKIPEFDAQVKVNPLIPAFTRRREVFTGRIAMIGLVAAGFWETILPGHPNIVLQLTKVRDLAGLETSPAFMTALIFGLVAYNTLGGLGPWSPTFSTANQEDVAKRPQGPPAQSVPLNQPARFLGITPWGFTKANEVFNGRLAMLGFLAGFLQQLRLGGLYGPGPLAQVATFLNIPIDDTFYSSTVPMYFMGYSLLAFGLSFVTGNRGKMQGDDDIY